jgi:Fe-S-cluster containining protein
MRKKKRARKRKPTNREQRLAAIYARIPTIQCRGLCQDACGPIAMTALEAAQMEQAHGGPLPPFAPSQLCCPLLNAAGRCTVYAARPLICRLWGVVERMPCEHGCRPSRPLSDMEAYLLMQQIRDLAPGQPDVWLAPADWHRLLARHELGLTDPELVEEYIAWAQGNPAPLSPALRDRLRVVDAARRAARKSETHG